MSRKLKITQEIVDFVESHKDNSCEVIFEKDFVLKVGEIVGIEEFSTENKLIRLYTAEGEHFCLPAVLIDVDLDQLNHEIELERIRMESEIKTAKELAKINWVSYRNTLALEITKSLIARGSSIGGETWNSLIADNVVDLADRITRQLFNLKH